LDKIKSEFEKRQIGTSKEEKQLKVLILEKAFKTSSWAEIEIYNLEKLLTGFNLLLELFTIYDISENKLQSINEYKNKIE
jgi:hypothetical protein